MRLHHLALLLVTVLLAAAASASAGLPDVLHDVVEPLLYECYGPIGGPQCGPWP